MSAKSPEVIIASHNSRTSESTAHSLHLSLARKELLGLNPEEKAAEPESDLPIEPTIFKLASVLSLVTDLGLDHILILAADVVFRKDGQVIHRIKELRDTTSHDKKTFSPEAIDHLIQLYSQKFSPEWFTSYGLSVQEKNQERQNTVTDPIRIFGDFPALSPKTVTRYLEVHATPGVDLIKVADRKDIKLYAQALGSDKIQRISHKKAEQIVVDRSIQSWKMIRKIRKQPGSEQRYESPELGMSIAFRQAYMQNVLEWMLAS